MRGGQLRSGCVLHISVLLNISDPHWRLWKANMYQNQRIKWKMFHEDLKVEGSFKHLVMHFRGFCPGALDAMENVQPGEKRKTQSRVNHRNDSMGFPMP